MVYAISLNIALINILDDEVVYYYVKFTCWRISTEILYVQNRWE